jgi:hypothetical protein
MSNIVEPNRQISDHFQAWEFYTHAAYGFASRPILEEYLPKYQHTLEFAERLRGFMNLIILDRIGQRLFKERGIEVTSAYRHLEYNRKVGSSDTSMHTDPHPESKNLGPCAIDAKPIYIKGEGTYNIFTYDEFWMMAELVDDSFPSRPYRLGYYPKSLFVHVDCGYGYGGIRWEGK